MFIKNKVITNHILAKNMSPYYYFIKKTLASFDENISRSALVLTEGS